MASVGTKLNNPGDLTTTSPNAINYVDQVGDYTSSNGLTYATFSNPTDGVEALADYVQRQVANGYNTVSALVYHFLGTSSNNSANPHVANYLATVTQTSGLSANTKIDPNNVNEIAGIVNGIIKGEGSSTSVFTPSVVSAGITEATGVTQAQSNLGGAFNTLLGDFETGASYAIGNPVSAASMLGGGFVNNVGTIINATPAQIGSAVTQIGSNQALAVNTTAQAASDTAGQAISAAGKQVSGALVGITNAISGFTSLFSASNLSRGTFLILGLILVLGAIAFFFADEISEAISKHPEALAAVA